MNRLRSRPLYWWALGLTGLLTAWALLSPAPAPSPAVQDLQRTPANPLPRASGLVPADPWPTSPAVLADTPASAPTGQGFVAATLDLFADRRPAAPVALAPAAPTVQTPPELVGPPPPAPPPPLNVQFAGRFRTPDGRWLVYLREGERSFVDQPGEVTASGYQLTALLGESSRELKPADNAQRVVALRFVFGPQRHAEVLTLPPEAAAP